VKSTQQGAQPFIALLRRTVNAWLRTNLEKKDKTKGMVMLLEKKEKELD
jgi:hypothetical protein